MEPEQQDEVFKPFRPGWDFLLAMAIFAVPALYYFRDRMDPTMPWFTKVAAVLLGSLLLTLVFYGPILLFRQARHSGPKGRDACLRTACFLLSGGLVFAVLYILPFTARHPFIAKILWLAFTVPTSLLVFRGIVRIFGRPRFSGGAVRPQDVGPSKPAGSYAPYIAESLLRFHRGDRDGTFFGLLETDHAILPDLIAAFHAQRDSEIRAFLVEVIWQHRQPSVVPFLGEALQDPDQAIWKEASNGLVTLASPEALEVLHSAQARQFTRRQDADEFRRWLDEAIEQVEAVMKERS